MSANPPRVLLVDTLSASNDFAVEMAMALDAVTELTVFTIRGTRLRTGDCRRLLVRFPENWGNRGKLTKLVDQLRALGALAREVWRHRKGVVHVQFFRVAALEIPLYLLMRPFVRLLVCSVHNFLPHERRWWHRAVYGLWYALIDRAHVLSRYTADGLAQQFGFARERIVFAPHGDYARFLHDHPPAHVLQTRRAMGLADNACLVLHFGLVREYKGVDRLIAAAACMSLPNVRVLVAGHCLPDIEQALRRQVVDCGAAHRVDLQFGHLENQRMSDLIAAADVVAFPYRHIYQSGALMLAMTYGKAILASDLPGFREYAQPDVEALYCDTADAATFAAALDRLAADPVRRCELGDAARQATESRYGWPEIARQICAAYGD